MLGTLDGDIEVTFTTSDKRIVPTLKAQSDQLEIGFDKWKNTRSLNANAYFHKLVDEIAEATVTGRDEIKRQMILDYGTVAFIARIPQDADLNKIYKYNKWIGDSSNTKQPCSDYYIFKPSHELNSTEMARLINGTVQEAKQHGIETRTPKEIADMLSLMEKLEKLEKVKK